MTVKVGEKVYKAITEQKQPFLITREHIPVGDVITVENKGRLQYAVVTCAVRHKGEYIIGLKTYLGKADYKDFARLRTVEAENERLLKVNADRQKEIERLQIKAGYW